MAKNADPALTKSQGRRAYVAGCPIHDAISPRHVWDIRTNARTTLSAAPAQKGTSVRQGFSLGLLSTARAAGYRSAEGSPYQRAKLVGSKDRSGATGIP